MRDLVDEYFDRELDFSRNKPEGHLLSEHELYLVSIGDRKLSDKEREWCIEQITAIEGYSDYKFKNDVDAANTVFSAWKDYCRDKELL